MRTLPGDGVTIPSDAVRTYKGKRQDFVTVSEHNRLIETLKRFGEATASGSWQRHLLVLNLNSRSVQDTTVEHGSDGDRQNSEISDITELDIKGYIYAEVDITKDTTDMLAVAFNNDVANIGMTPMNDETVKKTILIDDDGIKCSNKEQKVYNKDLEFLVVKHVRSTIKLYFETVIRKGSYDKMEEASKGCCDQSIKELENKRVMIRDFAI
uniref:Uncharacterized protein n=1 Tax=Tanacetum cinerariifolium TaxID=118510 RepID=A0A6L2JWW8_TANCI|nr:hypothetical protein [Tanacetum cinerariifolium]